MAEKKKEPRFWREQLQFVSEFKNAGDALALYGILHSEGGSPNAKLRAVLEFRGTCEDPDGELVTRIKRYDIIPEVASDIVDAIKALAPFENDKPPKVGRERFRETTGEFVVSLRQTPDKTFLTLQHPADGWKFQTEDCDGFFDAFCNAARW